MADACIIDAVRSPMGRYGGGLSDLHPADLGACILSGLIERTGADTGAVDDCIMGCALETQSSSAGPRCPPRQHGSSLTDRCGTSSAGPRGRDRTPFFGPLVMRVFSGCFVPIGRRIRLG